MDRKIYMVHCRMRNTFVQLAYIEMLKRIPFLVTWDIPNWAKNPPSSMLSVQQRIFQSEINLQIFHKLHILSLFQWLEEPLV